MSIVCRLCGQKADILTHTHLKKHGITTTDYKKLFPNAVFISEKVSAKWNRKGQNNPNYGNHPTAWNKGKKGWIIPRIKGLTREQYFGKTKAAEIKAKQVKSCTENPAFHKPKTEEHKRKIGLTQIGKTRPSSVGQKISKILTGKFKLEKNPAWRGGIGFLPYSSGFNSYVKEEVKKRDSYRCQYCGSVKKLRIHHIDYNKENNNIFNLVTLCLKCNSIMNFNREKWTTFWTNLVQLTGKTADITDVGIKALIVG